MDNSEAATTLLRWHVEGERELVAAASGGETESLLAAVERVQRARLPPPPRPPPPPPPLDWLRLREETEADALKLRLQRMVRTLPPDVAGDLEQRLAVRVQPRGRLAAIRAELNRFSVREQREAFRREFEALFEPQRPTGLVSLLLFSRDGRLLASEGDSTALEVTAVSALVRTRDAGSTWSLSHRTGFLVGHSGRRSSLVAVLASRPGREVGTTLRASVASLEQREQLLNSPDTPTNHAKVSAYLRTVRLLLQRERGVTPRLRA